VSGEWPIANPKQLGYGRQVTGAARAQWWTRPWAIVSIVWLAPATFNVINVIGQQRLTGGPAPSPAQLLWSFGDWFIYALLTPPVFVVARRWPITRPVVPARVLLHLLFALVFCVGWASSGKLLEVLLTVTAGAPASALANALAGTGAWSAALNDWASWILTTLPFGCVVYFSLAAIAHAIRYFVEASDREVQVARLAEQLTGARFAALQARVNPHFLFNTLNTVAVLVRDNNRDGAVRIVEQLSDLLRRTLRRHGENEVRLDEELELVRQYVAIEHARFSDRLRPSFDVTPGIGAAAVPSFAVQHLVENAIRHGVARREDAGRVAVTARREGGTLVVAVRDDGPGVESGPARGPGRGLANTRERLAVLHGDHASLTVRAVASAEGGGTVAELRVPFRDLSREVGRAD
jgi:two-component system, LytTR family, sensor kinase